MHLVGVTHIRRHAIPLRYCFSPLSAHKISSIVTIFTRGQSTLKSATGLLGDRLYNMNTNVTKDVILFKHDNPRYYKMMNLFAISQFAFWSYLSVVAFTTLRDAPVEVPADGQALPWYERINLGENKYRNGITIITSSVGKSFPLFIWHIFHLFHRHFSFDLCRFWTVTLSLDVYTAFGTLFDFA